MNDPAFLADAKKAAIQISSMTGDTVQKVAANVTGTRKETLNFVRSTLQAH